MAWSDSGQVTQSILGIKGMQQQKKNDRWSKLMDIANVLQNTAGLGADIWKTVSGRKHDVDTREDIQAHDITLADKGQGFAKEQFDWRAGFDADQAGKDRDWRSGQNALDRALDERLSAAQMAAQMGDRSEQRMSFLAEWAQRAYELAVSNPAFLGPEGTFDPSKREALRKFLYTQVEGLPNLSDDEIAWAKSSFDGFVDGLGSAPTSATATPETTKEPTGRAELLASAKELIGKLAGVSLPKAEQDIVNDAASMLSRPPSAGGGVYDVQGLLSQLQTLYNTWKYRNAGNTTGQAQGDIRVIKE